MAINPPSRYIHGSYPITDTLPIATQVYPRVVEEFFRWFVNMPNEAEGITGYRPQSILVDDPMLKSYFGDLRGSSQMGLENVRLRIV